MKVLLTGGSGLVGGYVVTKLKQSFHLILPSRSQLDITDKQETHRYMMKHTPQVVIHAAAFTDNEKAEAERGNEKGLCWRVNVEGTRHVAQAAARVGGYMIFISTGSVAAEGPLSWYAHTKKVAETFIQNGAVVRLSHPVAGLPNDYIGKMLELYKKNQLYPLFTDQYFPVTYMPDLVASLKKLIEHKKTGTFPVTSKDSTTPYELMTYLVHTRLPATTVDTRSLRHSKRILLDPTGTENMLGLTFHSWRESVDRLRKKYLAIV